MGHGWVGGVARVPGVWEPHSGPSNALSSHLETVSRPGRTPRFCTTRMESVSPVKAVTTFSAKDGAAGTK